MTSTLTSQDSLSEANRGRAEFSGHGRARGAAGFRTPADSANAYDFLGHSGDTVSISPSAEGFGEIRIGCAWHNVVLKDKSFFGKLLGRVLRQGVDLDLGCLYELQNGERGAVQAFGRMFGNYNAEPWISLSGDDTTGNSDGADEYLHINGAKWPEIKRLLIYVYIYDGVTDWAQVQPQVHLDVPGQKPVVVTLSANNQNLGICAIAGLENVRNGIRLTNYTEYFPGHAEMDRAFGFGLDWDDGEKS